MSESDDGTADVTVTDPEDYNTTERLKQIYRSREDLRKTRKKAAQYRNSPNANTKTKIEAVQHYRAAVESLVLEVSTLLKNHEPGPQLWREREYGFVTIQPPGPWTERRGHYESDHLEFAPNVKLRVKSIPDSKRVPVVGLQWLFRTETPVRRRFEFEVVGGATGETRTLPGSSVVPWHILNKMVADVNEFLSQVGVGLEVVEDTDNVAEIDYSDLI